MNEALMTEGGLEVTITPQSTAKQAFGDMRQWIEDNLVETPQKHKAIRQLILAEVNAVDCLDKHGAKPYEPPTPALATEDADILAAAAQPLSVADGVMQADEVADGSEG